MSLPQKSTAGLRSLPGGENIRLPVIQAPMFLLCGPEIVIASCMAGIVGSFPAPTARTLEDLESWLEQISSALADQPDAAPWALNLVMHRTNTRCYDELALAIKYRVPIIITALSSPKDAVEQVHSYGGKIYADVTTVALARKAAAAGVDGLALICAGAGGHSGRLSPFAFVEEVRTFFAGEIILSGAMSTGRAVRAAEVLGADFVYMGTRFIPTDECRAASGYKQMIVDSSAADIVASEAITGVEANWLRGSLIQGGYDPDNMPKGDGIDFLKTAADAKRWRDVWAAGQGVGCIGQQQSVAEVVAQLLSEYQAAH